MIMYIATLLLSIIFFALFIIGMFKPQVVLFKSRVKVFFICLSGGFYFRYISGLFHDGDADLAWAILIFSVFFFFSVLGEINKENSKENNKGKSKKKCEKGRDFIENEVLESYLQDISSHGYKRVRIKGTSFKNLKLSDIGTFEGVAVAEYNNEYDDYAIAIYDNKNKHIGYAPANNVLLHDYITRKGGRVPLYGYINGNGEYYWGEACIEYK